MIGQRRPERIDERPLRDELERLQVEVRRTRELEQALEQARRERDELAAKLSWYEQQDSGRAITELRKQVENLERQTARPHRERSQRVLRLALIYLGLIVVWGLAYAWFKRH